MDQLAAETEEAAPEGEQGEVFNISRRVCGKFKRNTRDLLKDEQGRLLTTKKEQGD